MRAHVCGAPPKVHVDPLEIGGFHNRDKLHRDRFINAIVTNGCARYHNLQ